MMRTLSENSIAILALCSNIVSFNQKNKTTPFTLKQWNALAKKIKASVYKEPAGLNKATVKDIMYELRVDQETAERIVELLKSTTQLCIELERMEGLGIQVVTRVDETYPKRLKAVLKEKAPVYLFYAGELSHLMRSYVGVVGSRDVDEQGAHFTKELAGKCVRENLGIVSGGAKGVDSIAQEEALKHHGRVVSFLHSGMESLLKKKTIREHIHSGHLTLLSSAHPKSRFYPSQAMSRNKYIYGLSQATFVVSASVKKGGTWAGAEENLKHNWVPMFVRNDDHSPQGNKVLLETYADHPLLNEYDVRNGQGIVTMIKNTQKQADIRKSKDVYYYVKPLLKDLLTEVKTIEQISKELRVNQEQASDWLDRAKKELRIKEIDTVPVKYVLEQNWNQEKYIQESFL